VPPADVGPAVAPGTGAVTVIVAGRVPTVKSPLGGFEVTVFFGEPRFVTSAAIGRRERSAAPGGLMR